MRMRDTVGMSLAPTSQVYSPEEFLALEDAVAYELFDGELVERHMSMRSSEIALVLAAALLTHVRAHQLGRVWGSDLGLQLWPGRLRRVPRADVVFVSRERLAPLSDDMGFLPVPPDLVAEVVSPSNSAAEIEGKTTEYLEAGVELVWVLYPDTGHIHIFRADGTVSALGSDGVLSGEDVIPGFACPVSTIFATV